MSSLLPFIHPRPLAPEGAGDGGVQAYGFRMCLTLRPENQLPFPRPDGYDPAQFELLRRYLAKGEYVMTQADLAARRVKYDSIGLGSYNIDIREVQRTWLWVPRAMQLSPEAFNEGYLSVPVRPYAIPYRCLLPRYDQCDNLVVSVCVSASHIAFASLRMEPQYMILGHAAGVAASLAAADQIAVQQVNIVELQRRLAEQGQALTTPSAN